MPPIRTHHPPAAKANSNAYDPWNSVSSGHQRADNILAGSTSWRNSRSLKLGSQFRGGQEGGVRVADTVGEGSENFGKDGRKPNGGSLKGASGLREKGQRSIVEALGARTVKPGVCAGEKTVHVSRCEEEEQDDTETLLESQTFDTHVDETDDSLSAANVDLRRSLMSAAQPEADSKPHPKPIFRNLTIYINGSTYPLISDHKLKHLLCTHGANISIALGRRTVTHVILGHPNGYTASSGAGKVAADAGAGVGLAGSKMQREISRVGGKGVKFVGAQWVIESIKAGKRLPEARFECLKLAAKGQGSVMGMVRKEESLTEELG